MSNIDYSFDKQHLWHPYSNLSEPAQVFAVTKAQDCLLTLADGRQLIDGTSSWWACVHGYSHPQILSAMSAQMQQLSHVMFGGITHEPAIRLGKQLLAMTSPNLTKVFYSDSGSVAVEVAMKMALQYWQGKGKPTKQQMLTLKRGYHGDTFAAMSVCDPDTGMHNLFNHALTPQCFADAPRVPFNEPITPADVAALETVFANHHHELAACIIEPIMQGAGAMFFYSADYLKVLRQLCDKYEVLLILDEIATGFGRTGKLFAYEHADIEADLLCLGKALTGGHISLAATLCSDEVALGISQSSTSVFMHGPTFMANPLACAAASASLSLIATGQWQTQVAMIEQQLKAELADVDSASAVKAVRVLGAVGVIEMTHAVNTSLLQPRFVELGVWVRPFGRYIYIMPPYTISSAQLSRLTQAMGIVARELSVQPLPSDTPCHG
ncbi:adenosylmethionine--8-amino-7-oxononanoate transaminase [Shewanella sp. NIFS-20-20]|uniref:adenosylmethionine--8-amino-7-oxononanoate transaminase n=1 Tax=Shewanella sp. NIFS-20-20 TaxID=2853806 RepID=UPI001C478E9A|nr:adenosylmethionine--8-amino-7-oxononanoate transaminase [Shewanella sp. NIFS-20-20]MBV7317210.1 adenosylmethionine--8-amino-7-oxononanoate transaminase [Shewanella sp. NIFS-20-20]